MALFRYTAAPASHAGLRFGPLRPRSHRAVDLMALHMNSLGSHGGPFAWKCGILAVFV